jgi:hypothetical protein
MVEIRNKKNINLFIQNGLFIKDIISYKLKTVGSGKCIGTKKRNPWS